MNGDVVETMLSEAGDVIDGHRLGLLRQLHRKLAEGPIGVAQAGVSPIVGDVVYEVISSGSVGNPEISFNLSTEVVGVGAYSVHASVDGRHHYCQHLPLPAP